MIGVPCNTWGDVLAIVLLILTPRSWRRYGTP